MCVSLPLAQVLQHGARNVLAFTCFYSSSHTYTRILSLFNSLSLYLSLSLSLSLSLALSFSLALSLSLCLCLSFPGFTAWCSDRPPEHVFLLLETLYREFDHVAIEMGIFKVETIGDCYMAVCGVSA